MMRRCGIALALVLASGACRRGQNTAPAPAEVDPAARRTRALAAFEHAALLKPSDESTEHAALAYAPIIVHELDASERVAPDAGIGALVAEPGAGYHVERRHPVVYTARSHAELHGEQYAQWVYHWWYAGADERADAGRWRWLRITLDREGFPQVWETLSPASGHTEIYVSQRLENMARAQYGEPASGCTFAIERPPDDAPAAAVVRVLNDGPVPMGPFVYLDADLVFTTVLCRCMPSQVRKVGGNGRYELWPVSRLPRDTPSVDTLFLPQPCIDDSPRLFEMTDPRFLAEVLRLPAAF